jgi:SAM-dependent methyltransferase
VLERLLPPARADALRRLVRFGLADARDALLGRRPDLVPPRRLMFMGTPDYVVVGDEFLGHFRALGRLEPHHRVLDVGCGIGRMARPLTGFLDAHGSYDGFDVDAAGVEWCRRNVSPRFPRFRFRHVDVRNDRYNPRGRVEPCELRFPYDDSSFDFVFLTSVFTHMLPEDVEPYVREVARVLAPGGRSLSTWFLRNDEADRLTHEGKALLALPFEREGCRVLDLEVPGDAIAIPEVRALGMLEDAGLALERPVRYGRWCGRDAFLSFQDIVVARKREPEGVARGASDRAGGAASPGPAPE